MKRAVVAIGALLVAGNASAAPLDDAIAAFRAGDCTTARARVDAITAWDLRTRLWQAGIAQRCGDLARAERVIASLLVAYPDAQVDLAEWWPSLAELVDASRPPPVQPPPPAAVIAPEPTLDIDLGLIAAGHDARFGGIAMSWQGSGLGSRASWRGERAMAELSGRAVAYSDAANDPLAGGGWELGLELRAGVGTALAHRRLRLAALVVGAGNVQHLDAAMVPFAARRYVGIGAGARGELAATRSLTASAEIGYLPLGGIAAAPETASPTLVVSHIALAWRATPRWQLAASFAFDGLRFEAAMPTGAMALHADDAMRVMLALGYAR